MHHADKRNNALSNLEDLWEGLEPSVHRQILPFLSDLGDILKVGYASLTIQLIKRYAI